MTRQELLHLLANNELRLLLDALSARCTGHPSWERRQVLLAARLSEIEDQEHAPGADAAAITVAYGQLRAALQGLIDDVAPVGSKTPVPLRRPALQRWWVAGATLLMGLGALAWGFRPLRQVDFTAELEVGALRFTLAKDWPADFGIEVSALEFYALDTMFDEQGAIPRGLGALLQDAQFTGTAQVGPLQVRSGQELTWSHDGLLTLVPSQVLSGELTLNEGQLDLQPSGERYRFTNSNVDDSHLEWRIAPGGALSLQPADSLALTTLAVQAIDFQDRTGTLVKSSIQKGRLDLGVGGNAQVDLAPEDRLVLDDLTNTRLTLRAVDQRFKVSLRGRAGSIRSGYPAAVSRMPTGWQWLRSDQEWLLVGSILAWVVGQAITVVLALRK